MSKTALRFNVACIIPFTTLQISPQGLIYLCCPAWTTFGSVGQLTDTITIDDVWNSEKSQFVRRCVYNESLHKVCNMKYCPYALAGKRESLHTANDRYRGLYGEMRKGRTALDTAPRTLIIAHSGRCNLRCVMCCSNEDFVKEDPHLNDLIYKRELPRMLPRLSEIILSGNGDPIFMKDSRELLQRFDVKKYPQIKFSLITNALLLNSDIWKTIKHNHFGWISVSIDAATKETYERVRRHGNWEILQKNLKLISGLRKKKKFECFSITFVVMKSNYYEMKQFVEMGLKLKADRIVFQKIFGMASVKENINLTRNKEAFVNIAKILSDPIFRHPAVDTTLIDEYMQYKNSKVTPANKMTTAALEMSSNLIKQTKIIKNQKLRAGGVWLKSKIPHARSLLGW
jgi:wyosine [tRNA(Phe)-imidazoG37] synthetase (radical SAM superfamily)